MYFKSLQVTFQENVTSPSDPSLKSVVSDPLDEYLGVEEPNPWLDQGPQGVWLGLVGGALGIELGGGTWRYFSGKLYNISHLGKKKNIFKNGIGGGHAGIVFVLSYSSFWLIFWTQLTLAIVAISRFTSGKDTLGNFNQNLGHHKVPRSHPLETVFFFFSVLPEFLAMTIGQLRSLHLF